MRDDDEEVARQDYAEEEYDNGFLRWMSVIVVLVAVAGFFALAWYAYQTGSKTESGENATLIEADKSPLKEIPADRGGLQFPHQDKTVYDTISAAPGARPAERLLPAPEEPVKLGNTNKTDTGTYINGSNAADKLADAVTDATAMDNATGSDIPAKAQPKIIRIDPETGETHTENLAAPASQQTAEPETATVLQQPVEVKAVPVKTATVSKPAEPAQVAIASKPAAKGSARVQLGAFHSEKEANDTWVKIRTAQAALISGKNHQVVRADLGTKGVFYRLQLTGFENAEKAKAFCANLTAQKQGCFPVAGR